MTNIFDQPEQTPEDELTLEQVVLQLDELLRDKASATAERAFGVSCLMSIFIVSAIAIIVFFFTPWLTSLIILTFGGMVGLGVSSFLASRSRDGNLNLTYQREIEPKLPLIIQRYGVSLEKIHTLAFELLPAEAPLVVQIRQHTGV